jgi:hypothetical protein
MAAQHRRLLRILLAHELLLNECKPFEWRDQFANEALHVLAQHAVQVDHISPYSSIKIKLIFE